MSTRQAIAFGVLAVLWGASFLFIKVLINAGLSPLAIAALRTTLGFAVLAPIAWRQRADAPRDRRTLRVIVLLGALNFAAPWTLYGIGQQYTPSAIGSIVNATTPVWTAIIAVPFLPAERLTPGRIAGLAAGFVGVAVLMVGRVDSFDRAALLGIPPMVLAAMCYAASSVVIRRELSHVRTMPLTVGQLGVASLGLIPLSLATNGFAGVSFGWEEWASLFLLGCVSSGAGVFVYMWLIGQMGQCGPPSSPMC